MDGSSIGRKVYAVASGEYSDYSVWCLFERQEDAEAYLRARGLTRYEDERYGPYWRDAGKGPFYDRFFVEPFDFYAAGEVPHANAGETEYARV